MTLRSTIPLLALVLPLCAAAQFGEKVRYMLNGDVNAPPDHDTVYVLSYRDKVTFSALTRLHTADIEMEREDASSLTYMANNNEQYGVGINYKWLSAELTFDVPALNQYDARLGSTTSRGFGLGYTGRRLWARGFWNNTQGYYLAEPERWLPDWTDASPYPVRGDLGSDTYLVSVNWALSNKKRYSQNAALFQMERQLHSTGCFVAGFTGWHTQLRADSSLLSTAQLDTFGLASGFDALQRTVAGLTIGYTHTFVVWGKGFINVAMLPGAGWSTQRLTLDDTEVADGTTVAAIGEMRLGAGFNGDRWYGAITTYYHYTSTTIAEGVGIGTTTGTVRMAIGLRFGAPRSGVLQKVGL